MGDQYSEKSILGVNWVSNVRNDDKLEILEKMLKKIENIFPNVLIQNDEELREKIISEKRLTTIYTFLILKEIWIKNELKIETYPNFYSVIRKFLENFSFDENINFIPIFNEFSKIAKLEALFSHSPFDKDKNVYFCVPVYDKIENLENYFENEYKNAKKVLSTTFNELLTNYIAEINSNKKYSEIVVECENIYDYIFENKGSILSNNEKIRIENFYEINPYIYNIINDEELLFTYYNEKIKIIQDEIETVSFKNLKENIDYKNIFVKFSILLGNEKIKSGKLLKSLYFIYFIILTLIHNIFSKQSSNFYFKIDLGNEKYFDINNYLKLFRTNIDKLNDLIINDTLNISKFINICVIFEDYGIVNLIKSSLSDYIFRLKYNEDFNVVNEEFGMTLNAKNNFNEEIKNDVKKLINYKYKYEDKPFVMAYFWKIYFETYGVENKNKLYYLKNNVIYENANLAELEEDYNFSLRSCK